MDKGKTIMYYNSISKRGGNMSFGEQLKAARKSKEYTQTQLADLIGYGASTVSEYEKGTNKPNLDIFIKLCKILEQNPNYFLQEDIDIEDEILCAADKQILDQYHNLSPNNKSIVDYILNMNSSSVSQKSEQKQTPKVLYIEKSVKPVRMKLQSISAGCGEIIDDTSEYKEDFPIDIVPPNTSYGIRVNGDSMEPTIMNGQIIWVEERKDRIPQGGIGVFNTEYGQVCKMFFQDGMEGTITLVSKNENYNNIIIDNPDFNNIMQGRVIGWCDDPKK